MTDKVQSDYRKYAEQIEPSGEFLDRLTKTLREEQQQRQQGRFGQGSERRVPFRYLTVAAAALALAVGVAAVGAVNLRGGFKAGEDLSSHAGIPLAEAGEASGESSQAFAIKAGDWHEEGLGKEELPQALARKLDAELEELVRNEENQFTDAADLGGAEAKRLAERIAAAKERASEPAGNCAYYMATFTDGSIVKFQIYEDNLLTILGEDTVYQLGE